MHELIYQRRWLGAAIACVMPFLISTVASGAASPTTRSTTLAVVGVVSPPQVPFDQKLAGSLLALLESDLTDEPNLTLVERQARDQIFSELHLGLTGLSDDGVPLHIGRLLGADLIVWGSPATVGDSHILILRLVEARTGIIRFVQALPIEERDSIATVADVARQIGCAARAANPFGATTQPAATIAVDVFENKSQFERLRPLARVLRDGITEELRRRPALLVLQRSAMQPLIQESQLSASALSADADARPVSRAAIYLLRGSFADVVGSSPSSVQLAMDLQDVRTGRIVVSDSGPCHLNDLQSVYVSWARKIDAAQGGQKLEGGENARPDEAASLEEEATADLQRLVGAVEIPTVPLRRDSWWDRAGFGQPWHAALLHEAIDELESCLFLKPDDATVKALLASACAVREPETWDADRAVQLYQEVHEADRNSALGKFALAQIPRVYLDSYFQAGNKPEAMQKCIDAYKALSQELKGDDRERSMRGAWEAARWCLEKTPRDVGQALALLVPNIAAAEQIDPTRRPKDPFVLDYTADTLCAIERLEPSRAGACRALLNSWGIAPSPYLRFIAISALGTLDQQGGDNPAAAQRFIAAKALCDGQADNWFGGRSPSATLNAARSYSASGDRATAIALLEQLASDRGELSSNACLTLGELYEQSGKTDQALELYRRQQQRYPMTAGRITENFNRLMRNKLARDDPGFKPVDYRTKQSDPWTHLCPGDKFIWLAGAGRIGWFDLSRDTGARLKRSMFQPTRRTRPGRQSITALGWTAPYLWVATSNDGLWRIDSRGGPPAMEQDDHWMHVDQLPDDNVTSLAVGDAGSVYVGVGVPTTGVGAPVKGGVLQIDRDGHAVPLEGTGSPTLAPERLVYENGYLWASTLAGVDRLETATNRWTHTETRMQLSSGIGEIFAIDAQTVRFSAYWLSPNSGVNDLRQHLIPYDRALFSQFIVETPDLICFGGRGLAIRETHELQCMNKLTHQTILLNELAAEEFESVNDAVWFSDKLWLATDRGLLEIDAVHFPATEVASPRS